MRLINVLLLIPLAACLPSPSPPALSPETDWLSRAKHGVFTHYLDNLQNEFGPNAQGQNTSWSDAVDAFDCNA